MTKGKYTEAQLRDIEEVRERFAREVRLRPDTNYRQMSLALGLNEAYFQSYATGSKKGAVYLKGDTRRAAANYLGIPEEALTPRFLCERLIEKTDDHSDPGIKSKLSGLAVDTEEDRAHIDGPLLAESIAAVKSVIEEQRLALTPDQFAVAVEKTYSEAEKFAERPSRSSASMAIKLLDKGRDNGRELET